MRKIYYVGSLGIFRAKLGFISRGGVGIGGPIDLHNRISKLCPLKILWSLRIVGSQNWRFGDPKPLLYTSKPLYSDSDS